MDFIQCLHNPNFCRLLRLVCVRKDDLHSQKGWILTRPNQLPGLHGKNCKVCQLDCLWNSPTTFLGYSVDRGSLQFNNFEKNPIFLIFYRKIWQIILDYVFYTALQVQTNLDLRKISSSKLTLPSCLRLSFK